MPVYYSYIYNYNSNICEFLIFTSTCSDRARGNGLKVEESRFRLDIRRKFFNVMMVRYWNRLPMEVVDVPFWEVFKARLEGALSSLI